MQLEGRLVCYENIIEESWNIELLAEVQSFDLLLLRNIRNFLWHFFDIPDLKSVQWYVREDTECL